MEIIDCDNYHLKNLDEIFAFLNHAETEVDNIEEQTSEFLSLCLGQEFRKVPNATQLKFWSINAAEHRVTICMPILTEAGAYEGTITFFYQELKKHMADNAQRLDYVLEKFSNYHRMEMILLTSNVLQETISLSMFEIDYLITDFHSLQTFFSESLGRSIDSINLQPSNKVIENIALLKEYFMKKEACFFHEYLDEKYLKSYFMDASFGLNEAKGTIAFFGIN